MEKTIIARDHEGKLIVQTKNFYTCFIIYDYLVNKVRHFYMPLYYETVRYDLPIDFCRSINKALYSKAPKETNEKKNSKYSAFKKVIEDKLNELQQYYEKYHFNKIDFSWLKSDKKACMWLWYNLHTDMELVKTKELPKFKKWLIDKEGRRIDWLCCHKAYIANYTRYIEAMRDYYVENQILAPTSHKERLFSIQMMFNYLSHYKTAQIRINRFEYGFYHDMTKYNIAYFYRNDLIESYKKNWIRICNSKNTLDWINKSNEKQCRWIWDFLQKTHSITILGEKDYCRLNNYFLFGLFEFINNEERYLAIFTVIYTAQKNEITDNLLKTMKKLWLQKERRASNKAKNRKTIKKQCDHIMKDVPPENDDNNSNIIESKLI